MDLFPLFKGEKNKVCKVLQMAWTFVNDRWAQGVWPLYSWTIPFPHSYSLLQKAVTTLSVFLAACAPCCLCSGNQRLLLLLSCTWPAVYVSLTSRNGQPSSRHVGGGSSLSRTSQSNYLKVLFLDVFTFPALRTKLVLFFDLQICCKGKKQHKTCFCV